MDLERLSRVLQCSQEEAIEIAYSLGVLFGDTLTNVMRELQDTQTALQQCQRIIAHCDNKPIVIKEHLYQLTDASSKNHKYTVIISGFFEIADLLNNTTGAAYYSKAFGTIKYISCCEHLFNIDDNKRYIQADKVKLITVSTIKLAVSGRTDRGCYKLTEQDYILYDPEDPYKIKAKREKDIAETSQEIETLRAKLVDAIERLNLLRTEGSGEGSGEA